MKKISILFLLYAFCTLKVYAGDDCAPLSSGVNYSLENQIKTYCFDSEIEIVRSGFNDVNIILDGNKLSVTTYGHGELFNIQIWLKKGTKIDATFVTAKAPIIKRVLTLSEDSKTVEIVEIKK